MKYVTEISDWSTIKKQFFNEEDSTVRDIYLNNFSGWKEFIDYLNDSYNVKFYVDGSESDKIDSNYVFEYHNNEQENWPYAEFKVGKICFSCGFYDSNEIEINFRIDEIESINEYNQLIHFMERLNKKFNVNIILTIENCRDIKLINIAEDGPIYYLMEE